MSSEVEIPAEIKSDILTEVADQLKKIQRDITRDGGGEYELECRLGNISESGSFDANVTRVFFDFIEKRLLSSENWIKQSAWTTIVDYFYHVPNIKNGIRTSVEQPGKIVHTCKEYTRGGKRNYEVQVSDGGMWDNVPSARDMASVIRIAIATETPVKENLVSLIANPTLVRIKIRKTWTMLHWTYMLTKVCAGKTLEEAEQKKVSGDMRYEIEIECNDASAFVKKYGRTYVALDMLYKAIALYVPNRAAMIK